MGARGALDATAPRLKHIVRESATGRSSPFACAGASPGGPLPPRTAHAHLSGIGRIALYERGCAASLCPTPPGGGQAGNEGVRARSARAPDHGSPTRRTSVNGAGGVSPVPSTGGGNGGCSGGAVGRAAVEAALGYWPHTPRQQQQQMVRSSSCPQNPLDDEPPHGGATPVSGTASAPLTRGPPRSLGQQPPRIVPRGSTSRDRHPGSMHVEPLNRAMTAGAAPTGGRPPRGVAPANSSHPGGFPSDGKGGQASPPPPQPQGPAASRAPPAYDEEAARPPLFRRESTEMVLSEQDHERLAPAGLGAIQPEGRAKLLGQWYIDDQGQTHAPGVKGGRPRQGPGSQPPLEGRRSSKDKRSSGIPEQSMRRGGFDTTSRASTAVPLGNSSQQVGIFEADVRPVDSYGDGPKLEWSSLSRKSRQAIKRWVSHEIGGRHCLMLLEHENAIDFLISPLDPDEVIMSDLRGGAMLNALSGFRAEAQGGREGGWLYDAVFAKGPAEVLAEAILAAKGDVLTSAMVASGEEGTSGPPPGSGEDLPMEQLNLAMRRLAMSAQSAGMKALLEISSTKRTSENVPRSSEGYMQVQVWLELLRLHSEGVSLDGGGDVMRRWSSGGERASTAHASFISTGGFGSFAPPTAESLSLVLRPPQVSLSGVACEQDNGRKHQQWDDMKVLGELGKLETELQSESKKMGLDALRSQNRSIEAYLMRLVRQRDELRHISRLADECDSYFILGLDGPDVSEDEVKKAYRTLARKEHPDKAGTDNKERFQQIQQAYTSVIRQRRYSVGTANGSAWPEGSSGTPADAPSAGASGSRSPRNSQSGGATGSRAKVTAPVGGAAREAAVHAHAAQQCAGNAAAAAYWCHHFCRQGTEPRRGVDGSQRRSSMRELCGLTRRGSTQMKASAGHLRSVRWFVCAVAQQAKVALDEYGDWSDTAIAGAGLRERAAIAGGAGKSSLATADLLDKICEANESAVRKAERPQQLSAADQGGARLLAKSLLRTASVARCAADEAISAATAALELSCSLVALDREWRRDRQEKDAEAEMRHGADVPPPSEGGASRSGGGGEGGGSGEGREGGDGDTEEKRKGSKGKNKDDKSKSDEDTIKDDEDKDDGGEKTPQEKARREHVALRVRNLRCLAGLNDEVLQLQTQLRSLLDRSCGALLPAISVSQKGGVFELVGQILHAAIAEAGALVADPSLSARQVLDHTFGFCMALEHARKVALSAEVKTQVLKLAALVDVELLCTIIDGPFKQQLMGLGAARRAAAPSISSPLPAHTGYGIPTPQSLHPEQSRRASDGDNGGGKSRESWDKAVHGFCERIVKGLKEPVAGTKAGGTANADT